MPTNTFHFATTDSPTQFNLRKHLLANDFKEITDATKADFSDRNLNLNEADTQLLESKHLLAALVEKHCPQIMPLTYVINDENYNQVLSRVAQQHYEKAGKHVDQQPDLAWILKPSLLNNAEGVRLFDRLSAIQQHFAGTNRFAGEHVLQQYITNPHLLDGHKYTFRMLVVISNFSNAYLYKHGYFNVAKEKYDTNLQHLAAHLTNEHLNLDHAPNVIQVPTDRCPNFQVIYQQMQSITTATIRALKQEAKHLNAASHDPKAFSLFGYDFMLDADLKLFLLEINHCPCFPKDENHPLQKYLYHPFWQAIVTSFVKPMVVGQAVSGRESFDELT